jgi:hypothetical protein
VSLVVENYFNYFTEIEEHYQRRRGTGLLLSTLDWALIETWKQADIPLEAVLRGIDTAFDSYERRPSKAKKINSLAYCSQAVLTAAEDMKEAAVGTSRQKPSTPGLEAEEIAKFFLGNADKLRKANVPAQMQPIAAESAASLEAMAEGLKQASAVRLEDLERHLTILEEKLMAALTITAAEAMLLGLRTEADREIAPYRAKMPAAQIDQLIKQFVHKRLFEQAKIPRLSLFYL